MIERLYLDSSDEKRLQRKGALIGAVVGIATCELINLVIGATADFGRFAADAVAAWAGASGGAATSVAIGERRASREAVHDQNLRDLKPSGLWVVSESLNVETPGLPAPGSVSSQSLDRGAGLAARLNPPEPHQGSSPD